jgi:hypothetical protein
MATLIAAPVLYLAVPLLLPLDLIPSGLTKAVLPKLNSEQGRGFVRRLMGELEGAIDRAGDSIEAETKAKAAGEAAAGRQERTGGPEGRRDCLNTKPARGRPPPTRDRSMASWSGLR